MRTCSHPLRKERLAGVQDKFTAYVDTLRADIHSQPRINAQPLQTVFFGGGTPSLIPPPQLAHLLEALRSHFGIALDAEISMEADPGTFDAARLRAYMALGVTRFSMGVQAFDEVRPDASLSSHETCQLQTGFLPAGLHRVRVKPAHVTHEVNVQALLSECGRAHTLGDVYAAIAAMREAAPPSWSLDLISGLPGLTTDKWRHSLLEAINAAPDHISIYDLQVCAQGGLATKHRQPVSPSAH